MKKVSVIVPCYNAARYLDKCMQQLLRQTIGIENMEIILVNDASTDDGATWNLITEYEREFPDTIIAVSLEQNMRQGGARNIGISYASGEYFIFCDADDWLLEETLEHSYHAAVEYDADVVEFLGKNVSDREAVVTLEKGEKSQLVELDTDEKRKAFLLKVDEAFSYGSQTKLYRLSMIREHHIAFAEHLIFEEPSFIVPVRLYERRHYFLDERLYVWYLSEGSTVRSGWEKDHKWDNPQVWMSLVEDLAKRDLLQKYYQEIEYQFLHWALKLTIRMLLQKGCTLSAEELSFLVNMTLRLFPDIRSNKYIKTDGGMRSRDSLLLRLIEMKITEESAQIANEVLRQLL